MSQNNREFSNNTQALAKKIRIHALNMANRGKSSHIGSVFSISDILAVLYGKILNLDPKNPEWSARDRFILSKGHAGSGVYAALASVGFFDEQLLETHYQNGSILSGHVSHKNVPGVELSTGSLGHGLSVGAGLAYWAKLNSKDHMNYVLLSDGECDEGSIWEAVLFSSHHNLSNLVAIVDYNNLQSLESTTDTLNLEPFSDKWSAFGWRVEECNGHDHESLIRILEDNIFQSESSPLCILANTTKGKGVSFMENQVLWHYRTPQNQEFDDALKELEELD